MTFVELQQARVALQPALLVSDEEEEDGGSDTTEQSSLRMVGGYDHSGSRRIPGFAYQRCGGGRRVLRKKIGGA